MPVVVLIVLISSILLSGCRQDENSQDNTGQDGAATDSRVDETIEASIEILEYRNPINTTCDTISIKVRVTNTGNLPISHSDITNEKYVFSVLTESTVSWDSSMGMQVSEFGTINPGETTDITFTGGEDFEYFGAVYHENDFRTPDDNGTFQMRVKLKEPVGGEANTFVTRGESDPASLTVNTYEDPSQNLLKSCEGKL